MTFPSQDNLMNKISAGQYLRREASKLITPAHTAGGWHLLAGLGGYPNATTFPNATDLLWTNCDELTGEGTTILGLQHGGNPGGNNTKHLINIGAMVVAAAGAPWQAKLVDLQGYYRMSGANVTGTGARTLINSNTVTFSDAAPGLLATYTNDFRNYTKVRFTTSGSLPTGLSLATDYWLVRQSGTTAKLATSFGNALAGTVIAYTNSGSPTTTMMICMPRYANGAGCQAFWVAQTQPSTGGPTLSASAYDDPTLYTGAGARAFQGSVIMNATADAYATRIIHSGNATGKYGPFLPLQGGDLGVARINSFTWSAGTAYTGAGVIALCIAYPLCDIALPVTGMWSERDLVNQLPSLPQIKDGACLAWMLFATGATTNNSPFTATHDFAWGDGS